MDDAVNEEDGLAAGDPDWVVQQLMTKYRIDIGILTGTMIGARASSTTRASRPRSPAPTTTGRSTSGCGRTTASRARSSSRRRTPRRPRREIHRLGDDPGMVQVLMASAARIPYGNKHYWPIYRAAVEHDLPVAIHVGSEGTGIANPPTGVGYPSTYLEFHTDHSQTMMAHCVSLLAEGVFEEFPTLKFAFIEGGICWAPYVMGRLDRIYPALKAEVPLPEDSCRASTSCATATSAPSRSRSRTTTEHLLQMLEMMHAEKTVIFASDYPHWDFDNPLTAFTFFPAD